MKYNMSLCTIAVAILLPLAAVVPMAKAQSDIEPFVKKIEQKPRIFLTSKLDAEAVDQFYHVLQDADPYGMLDHSVRPSTLSDADVAVFLLDKWEDVNLLPGQRSLSHIYADVAKKDGEIAKSVIELVLSDGRLMQLVFYNRSSTPETEVSCFAKELVNGLIFGEGDRSVTLESC